MALVIFKMIKSHHILNLVHLIDSDDFICPLQATHSYQIGGGGVSGGGGLGGIECIKVTEQCLFHCNSQMSNIIAYACKYQLDIRYEQILTTCYHMLPHVTVHVTMNLFYFTI